MTTRIVLGSAIKATETVETIDMTPTWADILPLLIAGIERGDRTGRQMAREELERMAQAADRWNASIKAEKGGAA